MSQGNIDSPTAKPIISKFLTVTVSVEYGLLVHGFSSIQFDCFSESFTTWEVPC